MHSWKYLEFVFSPTKFPMFPNFPVFPQNSWVFCIPIHDKTKKAFLAKCTLLWSLQRDCCIEIKNQWEEEIQDALGNFHVNSSRPLNPPSGILTKLGVYTTPILVRNYAKYFFPKPHSFVYRRDQNFKISPLLTIF